MKRLFIVALVVSTFYQPALAQKKGEHGETPETN